jgi:3-oxoacyl-[acyl-carrier protein] reductase
LEYSDTINMKLKSKVAVITGGARDLGRAISVKLASEGAKVVINYYDNEEDALETLKLVLEAGSEGIIVQGDMTKAEDVKRVFDNTVKAFGNEVHILVNVVGGIVGRKTITEQDEDWYNFLMDVNLKSCWLCTREAVPYMVAGSSIVNFSSLAARDGGGPGASMYATAKGAVMTFTRSMAKELGPKGIRVNALAPGTIATSFHDRFNTPENRERMKGVYPLRREGDAADVADLVLFLAGADSDYLTGTNIDINGGMSFS